ncbi:VOC family protein [Devosia sp.]|uniref:VOC family protein n=1 Tax=Devosia sp. TaxID=1871048 RepID=UPI00292EC6DE|nr:VOC family protein [Devosia sp.]
MKKITPCLWFNNSIDEAITFYTETFKDGKVLEVQRQDPDGAAFTATIELAGNRFFLLNGSGADKSRFPFTEAVSFMLECDGQEEVDYFWNTFVDNGGEESMCGWCKDRFGLSWQVIPKQLFETIGGPDKAGANRAMQAMLQMRKLIVADLQKAYAGA